MTRPTRNQTTEALQALTHLVTLLRKHTPDCGPWEPEGVMSVLRGMANRGEGFPATAVRAVAHAVDPKAKTPGAIAGSYVPTAEPAMTRLTRNQTTEALQALTHLVTLLRKHTPDCGPWEPEGVMSVLRGMANRGEGFPATAVRAVAHAVDPKAKTPGAIAGSYVPTAEPERAVQRNPRPGEDCHHCGGFRARCGCQQPRRKPAANSAAKAASIRDQLKQLSAGTNASDERVRDGRELSKS